MYRKEERGKSLAIATFVPYLGPALGPIIGGAISQNLDWPWLFYILSMFNALISVVGFFIIRESYAPVLLARRHRAAASRDPVLRLSPDLIARRFPVSKVAENLRRPLQLLWQRPIIQIIAFLFAINFGVYCLLLSTFATLWIDDYGESQFISTLHYIAFSIGTTISTQVGGRFMDWIFKRFKARAVDGNTTPEVRIPCTIPGLILIPAGLFWYGWSAETHMHWAMLDVGVALFVSGSFFLAQAMLAYLLDEFPHAASANAASRMLSNILGFVFPIFAPQMYSRLGYGWGNSCLAFIFVCLCYPVIFILWVWGPKIRALGRK